MRPPPDDACACVRPGLEARVGSSTSARCLATVEPLSAATKLGVSSTADISQDAHDRGAANVKGVVQKRLEKGKTTVLCSHGPVLPDIIARIATATADDSGRFDLRRAAMLSVGDFAVLHIADGALVAMETHRNTVPA